MFIICLSVAGTLAAGVHYALIDLPQQQDVKVPVNSACSYAMFDSCARYGDMCYECIALGETSFGCEISGSEKIAICSSPYQPKKECDLYTGLCIEV
ncbi:MAG: hypothetical protein CVV30_03775 [Methanomicrobiales archaeon HGW-Methanomicrobiales-1]|nr:MAG: hypothetical protein CVV30_03775 [Methanomicrobiales archaeon HGW-Methanomicrobiales-1]